MKYIVTLLVITFSSQYSLSQTAKWNWVNPFPTGNLLNQTYFLDENNGFVIGEKGTVLRTSDSGISWEQVATSFDVSFYKMFFVDNLHGWVIGNGINQYYNPIAVIINTFDGGVTWDEYLVTQLNVQLADLFFANEQLGWVVGSGGSIFKTTDSGITWTTHSIPQLYNAWLKKIYFYNESEGVIVGYDSGQNPYVFIVGHTTDGGVNWEVNKSPLILDAELETEVIGDSMLVATGSNGLIIRSSDVGQSWSFKMEIPIEYLTCLDFNNSSLGVAGTSSGYLMKSYDGGINWNRDFSGFNIWLNSVQVFSNNFLTAAANNHQYSFLYPYILTSTDAGSTWLNHTRFMENPINIYSLSSIDSSNILISGALNYNSGIIYKSTNGGISWSQSYYLSSGSMGSIEQLNQNLIFATGGDFSNGLIIKSTNNGLTWVNSFTSNFGIEGISIPDSTAIYSCGDNIILKSTDLGESWTTIYQPTYAGFSDIEFISSNVGYLVGGTYPSKIYKTSDNGQNWTSYDIFSNSSVFKISFPSDDVGYAAGSSGIYKTANGGISWVQLFIPNVYSINDVAFNNELEGWVIGTRGIYKTHDGGQTWELEFGIDDYTFHSFNIDRGNSLWAFGDKSNIIKYSNDLLTSLSFNQSQTLPEKFALLQNYPNPFNPTTTIRYNVPIQSKVSIKIYDMLGAEIATILNQVLAPGRYTSGWNATGYASGVYIYKLEAGEFVDTKKMILIK